MHEKFTVNEQPPKTIDVEVVYALPGRQELIALKVTPGSTASEVIELSGISRKFPEVDIKSCKLGIFSRRISGDAIVQEGDRVEIYRELVLTPKEARRLRAKRKLAGVSKVK